jgi:hypothetical protein
MLSTLLPVSPIVKSLENGGALTNLKYSTFFNAEVGFNLSFAYHWQAFVTGGYYSYDTRRENTVSNQDPANPTFSQFEMTLYPVVLGCRYRFNTSDIVPYVSLSGGVVFAQRRGFYDNAPLSDSQKLTGTVLQAAAGLEFYISPRTGLRLEMSATQLQLPARTYEPGANSLATLFYQGNPLTVRYASGLFVLF